MAALLVGEDSGCHSKEDAHTQVAVCNEKRTATRKAGDQLDRVVFCIYLRNRKEWFYTVGTVLNFHKDNSEQGKDSLTVYCSQLGKESSVTFCTTEAGATDLFTDDVDDELLLPETWRWRGKGSVHLEWIPPDGDRSKRRCQQLHTLSCVPIVIIPTNTVPIDYAIFFLSPFHRKYEAHVLDVSPEAAAGFVWSEVEEEGVEAAHDAMAGETR